MQKASKSSDIKAGLMEIFSDIRKYREEKRQFFFQNNHQENQMMMRNVGGIQRNLEQHIQKNKETSLEAVSCESEFNSESNITEDSTVTGHILNCFSDSSWNSSTLSKNEENLDKHNIASKKQSKPFLKKRTGLLRYMPKKAKELGPPKVAVGSEASKGQVSYSQFENNLKSKPLITNGATKSKGSRVHFKEPEFYIMKKRVDSCQEKELFPFSKIILEQRSSTEEEEISSKCGIESDKDNCDKISNGSFSQNDNIVTNIPNPEIEKKELDEFELLENYAQNSSFNSDSSVVQRVLKGEPVIVPKYKQFESHRLENEKQHFTKSIPEESNSPKSFLYNYKKEILQKEQQIEEIIQDIDPRINNLQKEICQPFKILPADISNKSDDRCSTPLNLKMSQYLTVTSDCDSGTESPTSSTTAMTTTKYDMNGLIPDCADDSNVNEFKQYANSLGEETATNNSEHSLLKEKIKELENEIEIYRKYNERLSVICKERDEVLRKLKKEYNGLEKYKEEQKKKFDEELENERRQLKRQKDTFSRFQKLHKDNPTRKEREELTSLRQEVEKLQGELKKQKIKVTNDNRRMKNQLIAAEKERDVLKLENLKLEEQVEDLLQAIKVRNSKKKKWFATSSTKLDAEEKHSYEMFNSAKVLKSDTQLPTEVFPILRDDSPNQTDSEQNMCPSTKSRVHFDPVPQYGRDLPEKLSSEKTTSDLVYESSNTLNENSEFRKINFSESDNLLMNRKTLDDNIVKNQAPIKEIQLSRSKIHICDDGTIVTMFSNGDIKRTHANKQEVYTYKDGTVEETFPCGLKIIEFPNGKIVRKFSDCYSEISHPDGTVQFTHIDKSEEIIFKDGTKVVRVPDDIEIIEFPNGEKEIRLATLTRKIFADGTVRIVYLNGMMATRYSNGRIRIKDKNGKLIIDVNEDKINGF